MVQIALSRMFNWIRQDGAISKAASPAPPPATLGTSVQGLTQRLEQLSMRSATSSVWVGHIPENATADISPIALKHDTISTEPYTGHAFLALKVAPAVLRHHGTRLAMKAIGTNFNWTLSQEIVFSAALTGKPLRKQEFQQYCWKRCVIGTSQDYAHALFKEEWYEALRHGDLGRLQVTHGDPMIFCPITLSISMWLHTWKRFGDMFGRPFAIITATARAMVSSKAWRSEGVR